MNSHVFLNGASARPGNGRRTRYYGTMGTRRPHLIGVLDIEQAAFKLFRSTEQRGRLQVSATTVRPRSFKSVPTSPVSPGGPPRHKLPSPDGLLLKPRRSLDVRATGQRLSHRSLLRLAVMVSAVMRIDSPD